MVRGAGLAAGGNRCSKCDQFSFFLGEYTVVWHDESFLSGHEIGRQRDTHYRPLPAPDGAGSRPPTYLAQTNMHDVARHLF